MFNDGLVTYVGGTEYLLVINRQSLNYTKVRKVSCIAPHIFVTKMFNTYFNQLYC